jgi:hypothetical protein
LILKRMPARLQDVTGYTHSHTPELLPARPWRDFLASGNPARPAFGPQQAP